MTLAGEIHEADWSVQVETTLAEAGGYRCRVHVIHALPDGVCEREFAHGKTFHTEREAALEGLRLGITWIEMKKSCTFNV